MLYDFSKLSRLFDSWGFPEVKGDSGYKVIQKDFQRAYEEGKIEFRKEGIYLNDEGAEFKGYMVNSVYKVGEYGFPKFHTLKCATIQNFLDKGIFRQYYIWSNSKTVLIEDRQTGEKFEDVNLELCNNCRREIADYCETTTEFAELLIDSSGLELNVETDLGGYVKAWNKISRWFRDKNDYTCQVCGFKAQNTLDRGDIHVHHKSGVKTDNREENLECLCVRCHSLENDTHEYNFGKGLNKVKLEQFLKRHGDELPQYPEDSLPSALATSEDDDLPF